MCTRPLVIYNFVFLSKVTQFGFELHSHPGISEGGHSGMGQSREIAFRLWASNLDSAPGGVGIMDKLL